ncbi:MAG: autotransporter domain-containing protein, partial [Alphaproteobacteria bacterium]|nr:autotransporter domain-containing protein [Alphaproteobacteria bacterium]
DTVVNEDGELYAANEAKINNLLANGGALIDLDAGTVLTGDVKFDVDATLQGGFDYSTIFDEIVTETGSLTLEGGINTALNQNSLVNAAEDKNLVLSSGDFEVGTGAKEVAGWKELNVINDATVKLVADANSESYINFGTLNLLKDTTLNLSGNSPLIATIDGSVNNDGHFEFKHKDDDTDSADDVTTIKGNYKAYKNAMITIDVDPITNVADKLVVEGDVEGRTKVVINPLSNDLSTGKALFVEAMNDDLSTGAYFDVYRVNGDAHKWNTLYENNKWYAATDNIIATSQSGYGTVKDEELVLGGNANAGDTNITQPKPQVVSEAIAYMSLPRIGLEQTKDLMRVVSNKVAASKVKCGNCGMSDYEYDGQAVNGAWIDLGHKKSEIDAPVAVEAKINAVDLGFDIQKDLHNRLGIFASYRQGEYELSGDGEDYYAKEGADIDIDSWILGLYHRYDYGRLWTMSSIYGGIQKVDMSTDDGVSSDTDSIQFGGSVEAGLVFEPQKRLTIEPSIRLGYNFIKYDDMSDAYGKKAEFDNVQNIEAEAGVKVEKTFFHNNRRVISKIYVKPSIIQNFGKGDVNITSLDTVEGLEDETLIRGEIGGSFNFGNGWSGFGSLGYTYGSDYDATDFNLGVNYNW